MNLLFASNAFDGQVYAIDPSDGAELYDFSTNDSGSGSAYIFKRSGTSWAQQAKVTAADAAAEDVFGGAVAINGDYAIVGAVYEVAPGTGLPTCILT